MGGTPRGRFATTRWSLVLSVGRDEAEAVPALAALCEQYWGPVYAFIRRSGRSPEDARDLTQSFFTMVLEKNSFSHARRERGRFRSFLLTMVRNFLANEYDARVALKRGGGATHLSLDTSDEERRYVHEPSDSATPESAYERRWALAVLDTALHRVRDRYTTSNRGPLFERLKPLLTGDEPTAYAALSADLGMSEGALRVALHRLRRHFGASLRDVIAETVENTDEVEEELRYLLGIVQATP